MINNIEIEKNEIRRLLFNAQCSLPEALTYFKENSDNEKLLKTLFKIALEDIPDSGRIQACYYISQFPEHLLQQYEESLLVLQGDAWQDISDHAMIALARIASPRGIENLIEKRIAPDMPWEAKALRHFLKRIQLK